MANGRDPRNPNSGPVAGGGAASYSSKMMRQIVESAPSATADIDLSDLPDVPMPSLEGIEINVPAPPELTEEDILERFELLYYNQCVTRRSRALGDPIQMGDEILLDLLGYVEGKIIPFSANQNLVLRLEADILQPGLGTELEGTAVGDTKVITIPMEDEDDFGQTRKLTAAFVCEVKGAAKLDFPSPTAPETITMLGLGDTIQAVYKSIANHIIEERAGAMVVEGMNMALNAVAAKIKNPVPLKLIQDQIRSSWGSTEGQYLVEKGLSRQDMDNALEGWLTDEETQQTARQRLKVMMALMSFARQDEQGIELEELKGFVDEFASSNGIDVDAWRASIEDDAVAHLSIIDSYIYIRTVSHLVAQIPINYKS